jgi:hypothetical protein
MTKSLPRNLIKACLAEIGRRGGKKKSPAKTQAARANAKKRWDKYRAQQRATRKH